ncbi:MAG: hypothetical protein KKD69_03620 [Euryarchaeota archaeon]|nr:hypothetical protein [Euryarchaeota archaeon]MBU4491532.1 hypothetical protein [Euryarchaeota archaeon]MCG2727819.1 hypothetical protein [Candidatus Methanoperedenaceae archaeon]
MKRHLCDDCKRSCGSAIPMHYGSIVGGEGDAEEFKRLAGCEVVILKKCRKCGLLAFY